MYAEYIYLCRPYDSIVLFCFFFWGGKNQEPHTLGTQVDKKIVEEEGGKKIAVRLHRLIKKVDMKTKKRKRERFC